MQEELITSRQEIEQRLESIRELLEPDKRKQNISKMESEMSQPHFWNDQEKAQKLIQELKREKELLEPWQELTQRFKDAGELLELAESETELFSQIKEEFDDLNKRIDTLETQLLLSGKFDAHNAILSINAGAGGTEACDWTQMLLRMYQRWAEDNDFKTRVVDLLPGEEAGVKNVTMIVEGEYACGYLRSESGVHRLVRISPFDASRRRHTSFASVEVIPEVKEDINIEIKDEDLKVDTFRASGPGGQHVNVTDSAIRITHLPTGLVTQCQNERSQHQNRRVAMNLLKAKLYEAEERKHQERLSKEKGVKKKIEWGSQIRSYVMQPYTLVKDHRTNFEVGNAQAVLDGRLNGFMHAFLKKEAG